VGIGAVASLHIAAALTYLVFDLGVRERSSRPTYEGSPVARRLMLLASTGLAAALITAGCGDADNGGGAHSPTRR
jgi:hypothetical protein